MDGEQRGRSYSENHSSKILGSTLNGEKKKLQEEVAAIIGDAPFILVINKNDLREEWTIDPAEVEQLRASGWDVRMSSAKSGEGVDQIFYDLAARVTQPMGDADVRQ